MMNPNQRQKPNVTSNRTLDPLVSPITPEEFAEFLGLDYNVSDDALLNRFLLAACQFYIKDSNNELLIRQYTLKFDRFPEESAGYGGLSPIPANVAPWANFPIWPVIDVLFVTGSNDNIIFETDLRSKPARISFDNQIVNDIEIIYDAGYLTAEEIPDSTILAILMLASYLYEHRGECSVNDAAINSGASGMWSIDSLILNL